MICAKCKTVFYGVLAFKFKNGLVDEDSIRCKNCLENSNEIIKESKSFIHWNKDGSIKTESKEVLLLC